jgi:hypothetical protein
MARPWVWAERPGWRSMRTILELVTLDPLGQGLVGAAGCAVQWKKRERFYGWYAVEDARFAVWSEMRLAGAYWVASGR